MGGATFWTEVPASGETTHVQAAFHKAVEDAAWEHGHGGYTGTIAEKHGYVEFAVPPDMTAQDVSKLLHEYEGQQWKEEADRVEVRIPPGLDLARMWQVYDDKWGPAVAFKSGDTWVFCGWASC
jgi:hypothetical protein